MLLNRLHLFVNIFWSACCICTILHLHLHKKCIIFPHIFRHLCTFENYHFLSPNHQQRGGSRILSRTSLYCSFIIKWAIFKFCLNHVAEISYTYTTPIARFSTANMCCTISTLTTSSLNLITHVQGLHSYIIRRSCTSSLNLITHVQVLHSYIIRPAMLQLITLTLSTALLYEMR